MPTSPMNSVIEHLRRAVLPRDGAGLGDGELLGCFIERHDEAALAALVERHGPMVWGVCRRQLSHHDAEDAFQATFLVLVRKAASIVPREMVGNFLYGVAHQAALQARRTAARRRAREVQVTVMPDTETVQPDQWPDVQPLLDQELSRLPDNYRAVIVLCDLEGRTRKEVACQLGCPEGTVGGRLARARAMLAKRLTARGVTLSGGALAAVLAENAASAAVPTSVVSNTISAASSFAAGQAAATGPVSVKVAALTEGVLRAMMMSKLKAAIAVVLVLGFIVTGATVLTYRTAAAQGNQPPAAEVPMKTPEKPQKEKETFTAWGKEIDGLQMGLEGAHTVRQGEKARFTVKLRNVGKADVKVTHGLLKEWPPEVSTADGGKVSVFMPIPKGYKVRVTVLIIKPGETITLYEPEVAVESEALMRLEGIMRVDTPTICVEPGKYKIAFGGIIQSHPKLTTGTVEFEVKAAKESATAWGKEVDGVQVGIQFSEDRTYKVGETVTLTVRLRNNGKKDVPFVYNSEYFQKNPPLITDADGKAVKIKERNIFGIIKKGSVAPGKEADLCKLGLDLRPGADRKKDEDWTLYGAGKFHIQYKDVPVVGEPRLEGPATAYATGTLELEVKEPVKPAEAFTEWGKEFGDLQAGLGFRPGEKRVYSHGETVAVVLRVRNVGKEAVEFAHIWAFFPANPPIITGADGKVIQLSPGYKTLGLQQPRSTNVAPGKEVELYEWSFDLRPQGESGNKGSLTIQGSGKFSLQCERIVGPTSANPNHPNPAMDKLATGKLELEIKTAKPNPEQDKDAGTMPIKIGVYLEKVNVDTSTITASCLLIGKIDNVTKPVRLENLPVSQKAKIMDRGKEVKLTDLKLLPRDTNFYLFLKAYEFGGFEVVGIETIGK